MKIEERLSNIEGKIEQIIRLLQKKEKTQKIVKKISKEQNIRLYTRILEGISNPLRVAILYKLVKGVVSFSDLQKLTGLAPAPLDFHLKNLKSIGLVIQDRRRGRYSITNLGLSLLKLIGEIAEAIYKVDTVDLDYYCFLCGKAKMKMDIFPTHLRIWCPSCGGTEGSRWSFSLLNPFGEEWKQHKIEELLEEGWRRTFEMIKKAMESKKCMNCNAQIEYTYHPDRIEAKCPLCGAHFSMQINDLTPERLFPLWKKYKQIKQKTEGPIEKNGLSCWKVTVYNKENRIIAVQYVEVGSGKEVYWEEF